VVRKLKVRIATALLRAACRLAPDLTQIIRAGRYAQEWVVPRPVFPDTDYLPRFKIGNEGFSLNIPDQLRRLQTWRQDRYQNLFRIIREDPKINLIKTTTSGVLHNRYYPTPDAEIYAAMVLDRKPDRIVEVGSGYSTLIARSAIQYSESRTKLIIIDPAPRTSVSGAADEIIPKFVEDSGLENRVWGANDLLFIDSSHVCRSRGDLPLLFCKILPRLPGGALVHFHDIFLPYEYPTNYDDRCYNEQYLLHCLLSGGSRYETLFSTHHLSREQPEEMQGVFGPLVGADPEYNGASNWLGVTG
jgi:Methyltransferase domain